MTPEHIDRVFGRGRLKMKTGEHVEVFREALAPGERRRYTKRFLATRDGDYGQWTEREWRILARLIGHGIRCVPDVVQFDGGASGGRRLVQTYDAGVTIDQWATLLPVARDGTLRRHIFEDCGHWWALAHHCLAALNEIHRLSLVHLDVKGDNICIPYGPPEFDPSTPAHRLYPVFGKLALIDFAFSVISRESLATMLPIGWEKDYDYQSPRLLRALEAGRAGDLEPTKALDWRCDFYSLAAMLKRYLPNDGNAQSDGWTRQRYEDARTLIFRLREAHDRDLTHWRPHAELMELTGSRLSESDLAASLDEGWTLARDAAPVANARLLTPITPLTRIVTVRENTPLTRIAPPRAGSGSTPLTRIAPPLPTDEVLSTQENPKESVWREILSLGPRVGANSGPQTFFEALQATPVPPGQEPVNAHAAPPRRMRRVLAVLALALTAFAAPSYVGNPYSPLDDREHVASAAMHMPGGAPAEATIAQNESSSPSPAQMPDKGQPATQPELKPADVGPPAPDVGPPPSDVGPPPPDASEVSATKPEAAAAEAPAESTLASEPAKAAAEGARAPSVSEEKLAAPEATAAHAKPKPEPARAQAKKRAPRWAVAHAARQSHTPSNPHTVVAARTGSHQPPPQVAKPVAPAVYVAAAKPTVPTPQASGHPATATSADREHPLPAATAQPSIATSPAPAVREESRVATATAPSPVEGPGSAAAPGQSSSTPNQVALRNVITNVLTLLRNRDSPPAPIEDRGAASAAAGQAARAAPQLLAQAAPATKAGAQVYAVPAVPLPAPVAKERTETVVAPVAMPAGNSSRAQEFEEEEDDDAQDALASHAIHMLSDVVPRVAAQAQPDVSRVLGAAAHATDPFQAQAVVEAAHRRWASENTWMPDSRSSPDVARRLHNDARRVYASGHKAADALPIELQAFGANPRDPEIASYLAYLHLRTSPPRAETARELILHAIALSGSRRSTRSGDWGMLAVASAMAGRETDAIRAYQTEIALTSDVEGSCRTALNAYANFGDRLRTPVQAMLLRIHSLGPTPASSSCVWPRQWNTAVRSPNGY